MSLKVQGREKIVTLSLYRLGDFAEIGRRFDRHEQTPG